MGFFELKKLPGGKPSKLASAKEVLPAEQVKNHVVWKNPAFKHAPFKLEEGESSNFGLFLTVSTDTKHALIIESGHGRSGIVGRFLFQDEEGRYYRDVDLKGIGYSRFVKEKGIYEVKPIELKEHGGYSGVQNKNATIYNRDMSENFLKIGIRTDRTVAILELDEIIDDQGHKISIEEAKKRKLIPDSFEPVIEVRAFGTKARLTDVNSEKPRSRLYLEDAKAMIAQESSINPKKFGDVEYINWLVRCLGRNLALMHKNFYFSSAITQGHNITLDGRFVDLESVIKVLDPSERQKREQENLEAMKQVIAKFIERYKQHLPTGVDMKRDFVNIFSEAYEENLK